MSMKGSKKQHERGDEIGAINRDINIPARVKQEED